MSNSRRYSSRQPWSAVESINSSFQEKSGEAKRLTSICYRRWPMGRDYGIKHYPCRNARNIWVCYQVSQARQNRPRYWHCLPTFGRRKTCRSRRHGWSAYYFIKSGNTRCERIPQAHPRTTTKTWTFMVWKTWTYWCLDSLHGSSYGS